MFKILYHHRTQARGVEWVHIWEMIKAWKYLGYEVELLGPVKYEFSKNRNGKKDERLKRKVYNLISEYIPEIVFEILEILYNFSASRKIKRKISNRKPSLIYERYAFFNWSGVREARKNGIPIILEVNYTSYTPIYRKRSKVLSKFAKIIEQWILKNASMIIVVSNYLKEHLIELGIEEAKILVLTNAADPAKFTPLISGKEIRNKYGLTGKVVIGFTGGFYPWHRLDLLLEVFVKLSIKHSDIALLLVGDGPEKERLVKDVHCAGLENKIIFSGNVRNDVLPFYISAFDIAVMPHSNDYGSPMKVFEYMSMEKPVVVPQFGPLYEVVTNGQEGFLFGPENISEFSCFLDKLIMDEGLRQEMGRKARYKIIEKHNWHKNASSVIEFFKQMVDV